VLFRSGASPRDVPAVAAPSPRVDLSPDARKRRGLQAAARHKTSIDALLHPPARGAGARTGNGGGEEGWLVFPRPPLPP
jgi:hypothetical protein